MEKQKIALHREIKSTYDVEAFLNDCYIVIGEQFLAQKNWTSNSSFRYILQDGLQQFTPTESIALDKMMYDSLMVCAKYEESLIKMFEKLKK